MADAATDYENHKLDGKPIRVSYAQDNASSLPRATKKAGEYNIMDIVSNQDNIISVNQQLFFNIAYIIGDFQVSLPRNQVRVYIGPLDEDVS